MSVEVAIAGMWGTTTLRALLLTRAPDGAGATVRAARTGPGAAQVARGGFEQTFFDLTGDWVLEHPTVPIVLAGMVGSTIGWRDVGYLPCPVAVEAIGAGDRSSARGHAITIVRGLACTNIHGQPDILRGEETEIAGWLALKPDARHGDRLACIPGTHAKWVRLADGAVTDFLTSVAGEAFAGLRAGGVLVAPDAEPSQVLDDAFLDGVRAAARDDASLVHQLFSVRARRVMGLDDDAGALQRLSGLMIGADVAGALAGLGHPGGPVAVIGAPAVAARYAAALQVFGVDSQPVDAVDASAAGLWAFAGTAAEREA